MTRSKAETLRKARPGWLLAVLLSGLFISNVDITVVNVANPTIQADLGASGAELELVIGGYVIAYAALLVTGARLGAIHSYRRLFALGAALFTLASLVCGVAPTAVTLIVARVAQGVGAALMVPQVLTGIQLNFEGEKRARALGLYAVALAGAAVTGQILGGLLIWADLFGTGWRPIFLINLPIGLALVWAALRTLPTAERDDRSQHDRSRRIDLLGVVTLSATLMLFVVPLVLGRAEGWPVWTWVCLAASVAALAAFVTAERNVAARDGSALLNLQLLARPQISLGLLANAAVISTYFAVLFTLALYLQRGRGDSALTSGLVLVPWVALFGAPGLLLRRALDRLGSWAAPVGCLLLAAAFLAIGSTQFTGNDAQWLLVLLLASGGFGLGIAYSALLAHLTAAVPSHFAPDLSGVFVTNSQIAGAIGVATFGTAYLGLASGAEDPDRPFAVINTAFALTAVSAAVVAWWATRPRPRPPSGDGIRAGRHSGDRQRSLGWQRSVATSST